MLWRAVSSGLPNSIAGRRISRSLAQTALREVIACFPVYRTYIRPTQTAVGEEDRQHIASAVSLATPGTLP